jgi:hypothetical protein
MRRAAPTIFPGKPLDWQDLENKVCQIFLEIGPTATRRKSIKTVRGRVDVDVVVRDRRAGHTFSFSASASSGIGRYPKPSSTHSGQWFRIPVRALDSSSPTRAFNRADEAALKAKFKPGELAAISGRVVRGGGCGPAASHAYGRCALMSSSMPGPSLEVTRR